MHVVVQRLLHWYKTNARDLPWRHTRDPYAIFISELMLQQTQVSRVIPKYLAWLERFSNWNSLASARTFDVLHAWSGLGYNRRGLYARDAAQQIIERGLPHSLEDWRTIRGVGPYMAAALLEFSQHQRAIVIDTNIRRVAGRIIIGTPFPKPEEDNKLFQRLDSVTPKKLSHWILPQAFMDFANAICLNRSPLCATCPLRKNCKASWYFLSTNKRAPIKKKSREHIREGKKYPDRIYRGRIMKLLLSKKRIAIKKLGPLIDTSYESKDKNWVEEMIDRMVSNGLLTRSKIGIISLPRT